MGKCTELDTSDLYTGCVFYVHRQPFRTSRAVSEPDQGLGCFRLDEKTYVMLLLARCRAWWRGLIMKGQHPGGEQPPTSRAGLYCWAVKHTPAAGASAPWCYFDRPQGDVCSPLLERQQHLLKVD